MRSNGLYLIMCERSCVKAQLFVQEMDTVFLSFVFEVRPANERRRFIVISSLIGWAFKQNDPCIWLWFSTNQTVRTGGAHAFTGQYY